MLPQLLPADISRVAVIDVHTGLGPMGIDTLMSDVSDEVLEKYFPIGSIYIEFIPAVYNMY